MLRSQTILQSAMAVLILMFQDFHKYVLAVDLLNKFTSCHNGIECLRTAREKIVVEFNSDCLYLPNPMLRSNLKIIAALPLQYRSSTINLFSSGTLQNIGNCDARRRHTAGAA